MSRLLNLKGERFGSLVVMMLYGTVNKEVLWMCLCDCGRKQTASRHNLRSGNTTSCGCERDRKSAERKRTHGCTRTKEHVAWSHAKDRCNNPSNAAYGDYGGRGIKFLFTSFEQFFAELGKCPRGRTLDRKDNDGNYEPGNVWWATPKHQANNRRPRRYRRKP